MGYGSVPRKACTACSSVLKWYCARASLTVASVRSMPIPDGKVILVSADADYASYCAVDACPALRPSSAQTESPSRPRQIAHTVRDRERPLRVLPLLGLRDGETLPDQFRVGDAPAHDRAQHVEEAVSVGQFARV